MESFSKNIGYSSGALFKDDFKKAIKVCKKLDIKVLELSTLRESELNKFIDELDTLDLSSFSYVSFHAPSKISTISEKELIKSLTIIANKGWNIVVHPDIIKNFKNWINFGELLCIENMDSRKPIGRNYSELKTIFQKLPKASLCFDAAHAFQIDRSLVETNKILLNFGSRIKQFHVSSLGSDNKHSILNFHSLEVYGRFSRYFKKSIPIIIESPVSKDKEIKREIFLSSMIRNKELNKNSNLNYTSRHLSFIEKFRAKLEDYEKCLKDIPASKNK